MARAPYPFPLLAAAVLACLSLGAGAARADAPEPDARAEAERAKRVEALLGRLKAPEADVRRGAAADARAEQDPKVTAALIRAIPDADPQVRRAVIAALATRTEAAGKKDAAAALVVRTQRLAEHPDDKDELVAAFDALHDLAQPASVRPLASGIDLQSREASVLTACVHAIANVPTAEAIESLIDLLAKGGRGNSWWRRIVRDALAYATGEKFPADPDVWRGWWRDHEKGFDFAAAAARRAEERAGQKAKQEKRDRKKEK